MQYEPQQDFDDTDALGKGFPLGEIDEDEICLRRYPLGEPSRLVKFIRYVLMFLIVLGVWKIGEVVYWLIKLI